MIYILWLMAKTGRLRQNDSCHRDAVLYGMLCYRGLRFAPPTAGIQSPLCGSMTLFRRELRPTDADWMVGTPPPTQVGGYTDFAIQAEFGIFCFQLLAPRRGFKRMISK